uniref:Caspase family p20 domain-containing protein n=1 Tax=Photinus pyralis TaxID=7054 RepID=A0A1Y1LIF0_PHOPY
MSYTEMEESDRETIQRNYATLVRECNIEKLLPVLEQKEVFPTQAIEKYKTLKDNLKIKRAVFFEIQSRGPKAFAKLVTSLHETDQSALAERLDPTFVTYLQPKKHARPFQLPTNVAESTCNPEDIIALAQNNAHNTINLNAEPLKVKVTFSHSFYDQHTHVPTYSTHSKKRGIVLIINMIKYMNDVHLERKGAEVDGRNLIDLFSQMGFIVEYHINLSANRIKDVIFEFKSSPQLEGCDMAFVIIMGHGEDINHKKNTHVSDNLSEVIGYDNQSVSNKWIEEQFTNGECKKLQNKPKIFMYQMCRLTDELANPKYQDNCL